jgi:hypothetical protein
MALKCLESEKDDRPTIRDIIQELKHIDTMTEDKVLLITYIMYLSIFIIFFHKFF